MIRLALIDGTSAFHGFAFSSLINRVDRGAFKRNKWYAYDNRLGDEAVITHVWDEDSPAARKLAKAAKIEHVVDKPRDVVGHVDGALLVDNLKMTHQRHAPALIKAGLPTFIDKPLSPRLAQAELIVKLAKQHRTPIMSSSALRYSTEIADRAALAEQLGDVVTCTTVGTNELFFYGIHPMTLMRTIMGSRIKSVRNVGKRGESVVRVRFADGRQGVLIVHQKGMAYTLEATVHGSKGHARIPIADSTGFYGNMLADFLKLIRTGKPVVPYDETLNIIRALLQAKKSLRDGREYPV